MAVNLTTLTEQSKDLDPGLPPLTWTDTLSEAGTVLALLVALIALGWLAVALLATLLRRLPRRSGRPLVEPLLREFRPLARAAAVLVALRLAPVASTLLLGRDALNERLGPLLDSALFIGWTLLFALAFYRVAAAVMDWYTHEVAHRTESMVDEQILPFARRVVFVLVATIALVTILSHLGVDVSAMVATLGVGSLAVALAAQSALTDTISGVLIILDRPFRIGDRIEILEIGTWGDVTDIGLRSTRIRTIDNRQIVVPNSVISTNLVVNYSHPGEKLRVETTIGVAYGTDAAHARRVLCAAVAGQDWVLPDEPIEALFWEMADSALLFRVRCWIPSYVEARRVVDKLNESLYRAVNEAGIEIPFPQRVVHMAGGKPRRADVETSS